MVIPTDTIHDIKNLMEEHFGIPHGTDFLILFLENIRLLFNGKILKKYTTLDNNGIQAGAILYTLIFDKKAFS